MKPGKLLYIAGPYSGDVDANIEEAERVSIELIRNGFHVFTPHKNSSGYEKYEDGSKIDIHTWIDIDLDILLRCDAIYMMNGWVHSTGSMTELYVAIEHGMPVIYEADCPADMFTLFEYGLLLCQ